jgi:hypothetical protein
MKVVEGQFEESTGTHTTRSFDESIGIVRERDR